MRILLTTDAVGGVWTHSCELAGELDRRGHEVTLAIVGPRFEAQAELPGGIAHRIGAFALEWMPAAPLELADARQWMSRLVAELRPDVVHTSQFAFAGVAGAPVLLAAHSDLVSWWRSVRAQPPPADAFHRWYTALVREGLERAAVGGLVVAPSAAALADLRLSYGFTGPAHVIANGRNPGGFRAHAPKRQLAVSVGRAWDPAKQLALLPTAAPPGWEIELAGEGTARGRLAPSGVAELLAHAGVYVACSCYEPFGLAPLEAALSGCALLLSDLPSLREVWGETALYFPSRQAAALAAGLRLYEDPARRAAGADAARSRALARYSAAAMADAYLAAYAGLARGAAA